jgi:hypothetical protein
MGQCDLRRGFASTRSTLRGAGLMESPAWLPFFQSEQEPALAAYQRPLFHLAGTQRSLVGSAEAPTRDSSTAAVPALAEASPLLDNPLDRPSS